jgi:hypothetical protein
MVVHWFTCFTWLASHGWQLNHARPFGVESLSQWSRVGQQCQDGACSNSRVLRGWARLLEGELLNGRLAMLAVPGILVTDFLGIGPWWKVPFEVQLPSLPLSLLPCFFPTCCPMLTLSQRVGPSGHMILPPPLPWLLGFSLC